VTDVAPEAEATEKLPLGTSPQHARLHRRIQRICYVLLIGLVIEGALVAPLTLFYYGWPTLSFKQICTELQQISYNDPKAQCHGGRPLSGPPFGGKNDIPASPTPNDKGVVVPTPQYPKVHFRELVKIHDQEVQNPSVVPTAILSR
jgi:hypothetical protein